MNPTPEPTGTPRPGAAPATAGTTDRWIAEAAAVARRAGRLPADAPDDDVWSALTTTTLDDVPIPPLGTADRAAPPLPGVRDGRPGTAGWDVRTALTGHDPAIVNEDALTELEHGATSLWIPVGGVGLAVADLPRALDGVYLDIAPVVLGLRGDVDDLAAATALVASLTTRGVTPATGTGFGADPLGRSLRRRQRPDPAHDRRARELADLALGAGTLALVVDGTAAHDAGAAEVGELGWSLACGVHYLRALTAAGTDVATAAGLLEFRFSATAEQFPTMAKLRAARALWSRVLELSGVTPGTVRQRQHAVSSRPMTTRYDPWVNLLRGTVAAFAAGVGGADAVTVLPFDTALGAPLALGRRLARNTSALLISESHLAQVQDPAGGAYAVEQLTTELAERGWEEFRRLEAGGGIVAALSDGSLQATYDATAAERRRRIADRRLPVTGVTTFPDPDEELLPRAPHATDETDPPGWAAAFEALRDDRTAGRVFLASLGETTDHAARDAFVTNALAVGGIRVQRSAGDITDLAAHLARSGGTVACVTGTDAAYREHGAALVAALRDAGARWIVLAGRPPADLASLVDDHLAAGADLLEPLRRIHDRLPREEATP